MTGTVTVRGERGVIDWRSPHEQEQDLRLDGAWWRCTVHGLTQHPVVTDAAYCPDDDCSFAVLLVHAPAGPVVYDDVEECAGEREEDASGCHPGPAAEPVPAPSTTGRRRVAQRAPARKTPEGDPPTPPPAPTQEVRGTGTSRRRRARIRVGTIDGYWCCVVCERRRRGVGIALADPPALCVVCPDCAACGDEEMRAAAAPYVREFGTRG